MNQFSLSPSSMVEWYPSFEQLSRAWSVLESWAVRISILLGILTLFPGFAIIGYDCVLYIWRHLVHFATNREDRGGAGGGWDGGGVVTVRGNADTLNTLQVKEKELDLLERFKDKDSPNLSVPTQLDISKSQSTSPSLLVVSYSATTVTQVKRRNGPISLSDSNKIR